MSTEQNQEAAVVPETTAGEGTQQTADEVKLSRTEYDDFIKDRAALGSLKREFKDLKKSLEEKPKETPSNQPDDLLHKTFLRAAGITADDEVELALATAKKWATPIDKLVDDDDFQVKLEKMRTAKANAAATANIIGSPGSSGQAKSSAEYWLAKGKPPTREDVPDAKARRKIARAFIDSTKSTAKFYND